MFRKTTTADKDKKESASPSTPLPTDQANPKHATAGEAPPGANANRASYCSFCGKSEQEVHQLIDGPTVFICDECVQLCGVIIRDKNKAARRSKPSDTFPTPKEIRKVLDDYVIGQEHAKKVLSVAGHNHYKRLHHGHDDVELAKSNILLIGPSGSGKTLLVQTLARILKLPFVIADVTTLTDAIHIGNDLENLLNRLLQAADYDVEFAQRGIIYIDQFDMILRSSRNPPIAHDVSGEGLQRALSRLMEGTTVRPVGLPKECLQIDTSTILFICGGIFEGVEITPQSRTRRLVSYGLIPELAGRLPVVARLEKLDESSLKRVLVEPRNALIKQFQHVFEIEGIELTVTDDALAAIARKAIDEETGAWGLRTIVEGLLLDTMFDLPNLQGVEEVVISKEVVDAAARPQYVYADRGT